MYYIYIFSGIMFWLCIHNCRGTAQSHCACAAVTWVERGDVNSTSRLHDQPGLLEHNFQFLM